MVNEVSLWTPLRHCGWSFLIMGRLMFFYVKSSFQLGERALTFSIPSRANPPSQPCSPLLGGFMTSMETFKNFVEGLDPKDPVRAISLSMLNEAILKQDVKIFRNLLTPWIATFGHKPEIYKLLKHTLAQLASEEEVAVTICSCLNFAINGGKDVSQKAQIS